ncbi:hypothetical protein BD769DRAFT_1674372 [Suillus cothurnatus]|nr:hypothetical protein BD769DRAFT_1674372 [Suillus cothurnatus]
MDTSNSAQKQSMSPSTKARYKESKIGIKRPKLEAPDAEPRRPKREVPDAEPMLPVPPYCQTPGPISVAQTYLRKLMLECWAAEVQACKNAKKLQLLEIAPAKDLTPIQASLQRLVSERWEAEVKHCEEAKKKIDELLHGPAWSCKKVSTKGNKTDENGQSLHKDVELWMCDPVECIKDLIRNPLFKEHMVYTPSQAYQDEAGSQQLIDDMWMADWWWDKQNCLKEPP